MVLLDKAMTSAYRIRLSIVMLGRLCMSLQRFGGIFYRTRKFFTFKQIICGPVFNMFNV